MKESRFEELRENIKEVDREMVRLLNQRARISLEIGRIKTEQGLEVYDPSQEQKIYENLARANAGEGGAVSLKALRTIFSEVIASSRVLQSPVTVAYPGPETSFAHLAAQSHFGVNSRFFPQPSIPRVFQEVEKETVTWGVVPVENSLEGSVNLTLEKLINTPLTIRAEIMLRIRHYLLSQHKKIDDVKRVYAHPQAMAQCREWLQSNLPKAIFIEVNSAVEAMQKVIQEKKGAAIGAKVAADIYELHILTEGIEDNVWNTTRFFVIGNGEGESTGNDKTSLLFAAPHTPRALYRALQPFADRGINLMRIESYPVKDRLWEYLFFVDVLGHIKDEIIKECLDDLGQKTSFIKILGSYPKSEVIQ